MAERRCSIANRSTDLDRLQDSAIEACGDPVSLVTEFQDVAASYRSHIAVCSDTWQATYDELNATANRLAHALIKRGCAPGDRVAILMQHDTPQIAALLGALKAGQIVVTLSPTDSVNRLGQVMEDAAPGLLITDRPNHRVAEEVAKANCQLVCYDDEARYGPAHNPGIVSALSAPAHLVLTSGSTGRPKGVQQTHGQILRQTVGYTRATRLTSNDRLTLLAALSGGQGVATMWTALLNGAALFPFSVGESSILALADWITRRGITVYFSSASLFRKLTSSLDQNVTFPHVRAVRLSSETVTSEDFKSFQQRFSEKCTFVHTLASSEIGLIAFSRLLHDDSVAEGRIPVGHPVDELEIRLLDEHGEDVAQGQVGEIVVRGRHMSAGYWQDAPLTSERFFEVGDGSGTQVVHTGDLGRFGHNGMLEFVGRKDSRVKIRGYSVEPAEVEAAITKIPGVKAAAIVTLRGSHGQPQLAAHVVTDEGHPHNARTLRKALRSLLPSYMVPSTFVFVDQFPLTSHGKIDRAQLSASATPTRAMTSQPFPLTETEQKLVSIWEQVLDVAGIGIDDDFFDLGGDSLIAAVMSTRLHEAFGLEIQIGTLFDFPILSELARTIDDSRQFETRNTFASPVQRSQADTIIPLTYNQESVWHLARTTDSATVPIISRCSRITGPLDVKVLTKCIRALFQRHEMLRTSFSMVNGHPAQIVHEASEVPLGFYDFGGDRDAEAKARQVWKAEAARTFDLTKPPLVFFTLIRLSDNDHWLVYTAHSILLDALSWGIFFSDLARVYEAALNKQDISPLDPPAPRYSDYARWQRHVLHTDGTRYAQMLAWWTDDVLTASYPDHALYRKAMLWCMSALRLKHPLLRKIVGTTLRTVLWAPLPPRSELPFKRDIPAKGADPLEGVIRRRLNSITMRRLNDLARQESATEYTALLAAYVALLASEMNNANVVVYSALSNRNRPGTAGLFGSCATPAMLMFRCDDNLTFRNLLQLVRDRLRIIQQYADLPCDRVHREMRSWKIKMPQGRAILSTVRGHACLRCANIEIVNRSGVMVSVMPRDFNVIFDNASEEENCSVLFNAEIYDPAKVHRFTERFNKFLDVVSCQPDTRVNELIARLEEGK